MLWQALRRQARPHLFMPERLYTWALGSFLLAWGYSRIGAICFIHVSHNTTRDRHIGLHATLLNCLTSLYQPDCPLIESQNFQEANQYDCGFFVIA